MKAIRTLVAVLAVAALVGVGAIVALAAPGAVAQVAAPGASAARAEYCPPEELESRQDDVKSFKAGMKKARDKYYKTHKKAKDRQAFVKKQNAQLAKLQKRVDACDE